MDIKLKLPDSFFKEEIRNGFLVKTQIKELWAVQLDLLSEFDRVCRKHDLRYILDFGTLLGAVRHQGFIPWDDDVDVSMLREDYDKLMEIGPKEFSYPYFFQNHKTDSDYDNSTAKLRRSDTSFIESEHLKHRTKYNKGIFIDIFVWDNIPTDDKDFVTMINQKTYDAYLHFYVVSHRPSLRDGKKFPLTTLRFLYYLLRYGSAKSGFKRLESLSTQYEKSDFVADLMYYKSESRLRRWHEETTEMSFEGMLFPVPLDYDGLLADCFGDNYMTPIQCNSDHTLVYLDTSRPYDEVLKEHYC